MPTPRRYKSHAERQAAYRKRCEEARAQLLEQKGLPPLPAVASIPGHARWRRAMSAIECQLTQIAAEMQSYYDERSESWQEGERGDDFQQKADDLNDVLELVSDWLV